MAGCLQMALNFPSQQWHVFSASLWEKARPAHSGQQTTDSRLLEQASAVLRPLMALNSKSQVDAQKRHQDNNFTGIRADQNGLADTNIFREMLKHDSIGFGK